MQVKGERPMTHLRTPARYLLSKTLLLTMFGALLLPLNARAQTLITSDSLLNTGSPLTESSNAPGTNGAVGLVHSSSNTSVNLWLIYTNPWGVTSGSGTISMNYSGSGSIVTSINLTGLPGGGVDGSPF